MMSIVVLMCVDKGTIVNAITESGFTTVEEVTAKTKAGNSW